MEIRRLASIEELFAVADGDHLVRTDVSPGSQGIGWVTADGAFAFCGPTDGGLRGWLTVIGKPGPSVDALVRTALDDLPKPPMGLSVPRGTDLDWLDLHDREQWDYMVFDESSGPLAMQPGEERVVAMRPGPETDAEIGEFLKRANPTYSAQPGWDAIRSWASVRDETDGTLLAVGAYCVRDGGNGYLASIGTLPAARGRGLGQAVTAWLTRQSVEDGNAFCSLGHYWPNEPAQRLYLRLGYRTTHEMSSGRIEWAGAHDASDDLGVFDPSQHLDGSGIEAP